MLVDGPEGFPGGGSLLRQGQGSPGGLLLGISINQTHTKEGLMVFPKRLTTNELQEKRLTVSEAARGYGLKAFDPALPVDWVRQCQAAGFQPVGQVVWSYERNRGFGEAFPLSLDAEQELKRIFPGAEAPPVSGALTGDVPEVERQLDVLHRAKAALPLAWQGQKQGYPREVETLLTQAIEARQGSRSTEDAQEEVLEALVQVRAALPDKSFARQYKVDPALVDDLNSTIDRLEDQLANQPGPR